jgi:hypothetical protein
MDGEELLGNQRSHGSWLYNFHLAGKRKLQGGQNPFFGRERPWNSEFSCFSLPVSDNFFGFLELCLFYRRVAWLIYKPRFSKKPAPQKQMSIKIQTASRKCQYHVQQTTPQ